MGIPFYHTHQSQKGGIKEKMNTLRKMRKNAKALSPVVASIILIAVTVAVSIAVAAWMGALVVGNMDTEQLKVTNVDFTDTATAVLTIKNSGSSSVTIDASYLGTSVVETDIGMPVAPNTAVDLPIAGTYAAGNAYQFKVVSTKGNAFVYTATAPTPLAPAA